MAETPRQRLKPRLRPQLRLRLRLSRSELSSDQLDSALLSWSQPAQPTKGNGLLGMQTFLPRTACLSHWCQAFRMSERFFCSSNKYIGTVSSELSVAPYGLVFEIPPTGFRPPPYVSLPPLRFFRKLFLRSRRPDFEFRGPPLRFATPPTFFWKSVFEIAPARITSRPAGGRPAGARFRSRFFESNPYKTLQNEAF